MAHKGTKQPSWKFWKRWTGTERVQDEEAWNAPVTSFTPMANSTEITDRTKDAETQEQILNDINPLARSTTINKIGQLKVELDAFRPFPPEVVGRVEQKLRLESNYHSNAVEGNSLTLGETRSLILHGLTANGKPIRDHLDIKGHDEAVKAIDEAVKRKDALNEVFIRNLHKVLLKEPYEIDAVTPDGQPTKRRITIGSYKTQPNNVRTSTGEEFYFTPPDQVKPAMSDLIEWYRKIEIENEHPIVIAATFHYRFVRIHPFDDGNGRMARLLMNLILIKHGYTVAIVPIEERTRYINSLEEADKIEDLTQFISYIAHCCEYTLDLYLKAARGEEIEDIQDIDKEIVLFKRSLEKGTYGTINVREYTDKVLYPLLHHCQEKLRKFSDLFESVSTMQDSFSVKGDDNQISRFSISGEKSNPWPETALFISGKLHFWLASYQAKSGIHFELLIETEEESNRSLWKFYSRDFDYDEEYTGRDLQTLKKMFNDMIRQMMKKLSENPDD